MDGQKRGEGSRGSICLRAAGKWLWLAVAFAAMVFFLNAGVDGWLDADMSSELVLAKLLNSEGAALSSNWYYSTELRVLNTQLVFAPLFSVFGDWHAIRVVGTVILYAVLLASYGYFCRQAGLSRILPWTAPILFLPIPGGYFRYVLMGTYYIPHIAITFAVLGMVFHAVRSGAGVKRLVLLAGASALSLLAGMGGMRQLLVLYIPLFLTALVLWFAQAAKDAPQPETGRACPKGFMTAALLVTGFAVAGCALNIAVLSRTFHFMRYDEGGVGYTPFSLDKLSDVLAGFLNTLGYQSGGALFSIHLVYNGACALAVLAAVGSLIYVLRVRSRLTFERRFIAVFSAMAVAVFAALYMMTDMKYVDRYNIPVIVMALPVCGIALEEVPWKRGFRRAVCVLLSVSVAVSSYAYVVRQGKTKLIRGLEPIAERLVEAGYEAGYAIFWYGNLLTELSDGQLEAYTFSGHTSEVTDPDELQAWLQRVDHLTQPPQGKVFVMLAWQEQRDFTLAEALKGSEVVYEVPEYIVYGFESYEALKEKASGI